MLKYCPKCKKRKHHDEFPKSAKRYDGLGAYCKLCFNLYRNKAKKPLARPAIKGIHLELRELQIFTILPGGSYRCNACGMLYVTEDEVVDCCKPKREIKDE